MKNNTPFLHRWACGFGVLLSICLTFVSLPALGQKNSDGLLDQKLQKILHQSGFTGRVEFSLETRLHRKLNPQLADLGRLLFFDVAGGLHDDNTCVGCHSPSSGFGDTQSIAIGVQNDLIVGRERTGPRNQRRTPSVVNTAFSPSPATRSTTRKVSNSPSPKGKPVSPRMTRSSNNSS